MKTLIAYPFYAPLESDDAISYQPNILEGGEPALIKALIEEKPDVLVVGNNPVKMSALKEWTLVKKRRPLTIVRRGASLAQIDTRSAQTLGIDVLNTPGVNSPFVAQYILEQLGLKNKKHILPGHNKKVAILGTGQVGGRLARQLAKKGYHVVVFSPSIATKRKEVIQAKDLNYENIEAAGSLLQAMFGAEYVMVTIDAKRIESKAEKIDEDLILSIKEGGKIFSIAESNVFTEKAILRMSKLVDDGILSVHFDTTPNDAKELRQLVGENSRINVTSNAMKAPACQQAMDQAVQLILAELNLTYLKSNNLTTMPVSQVKKNSNCGRRHFWSDFGFCLKEKFRRHGH